MPGMDGLEAAWRIRAMEAATHPCICQDAVVPVLHQSYILCDRFSDSHVERASPDHICVPGRDVVEKSKSFSPGACDCCAPRVPIWAVSASSLQEQASSPAMKFMPPTNKGRLFSWVCTKRNFQIIPEAKLLCRQDHLSFGCLSKSDTYLKPQDSELPLHACLLSGLQRSSLYYLWLGVAVSARCLKA